MVEQQLRDAIRPSLRREQQILAAAAAIALAISVAALRSPRADAGSVVTWFGGCIAFALIGRAWYRWRVRTGEALVTALAAGTPAKNIAIARFKINYVIPFGYVVALDAGALRNVNVGFWSRRDADRFVAVVSGQPTAGALPGARVV